jgi:PAS domain S-box-containing protein
MVDAGSRSSDLRLDESEARYRAVIENASDMIQSVLPDGTFEFVNGAWKNTLGYTDEDLASMTIFEVIDPEFLEHCMLDFQRAINGETVDFLATSFLTKDGRSVPVEGSVTSRFLGDEVVATHGFFRDISERLLARELEERTKMLEQEERARYLEKMAALGKLSAGLAHELNNPAAAIRRASAGVQETFLKRDAAMLKLAASELEPAAWATIEEIGGRAFQAPLDAATLLATESAIETWLEDQGVERAWERAPTFAEAGISVEDLEVICSQIPPGSLPDAVGWITESLVLSESCEIIAQSSRRIEDLVLAIKGYSHMDRATVHDSDIHEGLENTLVILAHRLRNIEVDRQYDRSIPPIQMFGNTLNQVWTNILDNAIDAMDEAGRISIRTFRQGDDAIVEIEDSGCGIPAESLPRIFEPFYTLKPQGEGTGLGLDTAWRIVTGELDGAISATSHPGQTVFRISLPIVRLADSSDAAVEPDATDSAPSEEPSDQSSAEPAVVEQGLPEVAESNGSSSRPSVEPAVVELTTPIPASSTGLSRRDADEPASFLRFARKITSFGRAARRD